MLEFFLIYGTVVVCLLGLSARPMHMWLPHGDQLTAGRPRVTFPDEVQWKT